jgi:hypothetical protein
VGFDNYDFVEEGEDFLLPFDLFLSLLPVYGYSALDLTFQLVHDQHEGLQVDVRVTRFLVAAHQLLTNHTPLLQLNHPVVTLLHL